MDFQDILAQASHNAKKASKVVNNLEQEAQERKIRQQEHYKRELAREREERKRKAPPKVEKKFVIPKKKETNDSVDPNALHHYMEKQRKEQNEKEIQKKKERDKLIGLRLQANQGKANKKIAAQFGKSAIELQQRYAPNPNMEMELMKRQQREQEELERNSASLRDSITRAMKDRAAILARTSTSTGRKEKTRVGNVKAGGFADTMAKQEAVLTKRKAETFNTFSSTREKPKKPKIAPSGEAKLDFNALMAKAQQNSDVKNVAAKADQILRNNQQQRNGPSNSREVMKCALVEQKKVVQTAPTLKPSNGQPSSRNQVVSSSNQSLVKRPSKIENPYAMSDRQILGPPSIQKQQMQKKPVSNRGDRPLPQIPQPPPPSSKKEQRILPGDIRYNPSMAKKTPSSSSGPSNYSNSSNSLKPRVSSAPLKPVPNSSNSSMDKNKRPHQQSSSQSSFKNKEKRVPTSEALNDLFGSPPRSTNFKRPLSPTRNKYSDYPPDRYGKQSSSMSRKHDRSSSNSRPRSNPAMFGRRGAPSTSYLSGYNSEEDEFEDEEDDYDSEMDDFIDDTNLEELQVGDFEESLKSINRNYDKRKWQMRERMIDDRRMEASYGDIDREEKRSAKLALYEDYVESKKGSKGIA